MGSRFQQTRDIIRFKIQLNVALGELEPQIAAVWVEAFNSLSDDQLQELIGMIESLDPAQACKITLRYLMDNYYPFRELILYQTDEAFKRRMGLSSNDRPEGFLQ